MRSMDSVALDVVTFMHSMEKFIDFADANGISLPELFEKILEIFRDIPGDDPFDCAARETEILEYLEKLGLYKYKEDEECPFADSSNIVHTIDEFEQRLAETKTDKDAVVYASVEEYLLKS
jgi:hypothetical protein